MNREKLLVKNTLILSFGTFLPNFVSLITTPILTGKLTNAEYGTYDLILTLVMLLLPISTLQIQAAGFRFIISVRDDKEKCTEIISNIFAVLIPAMIISSVCGFIFLRNQDILFAILLVLFFSADIVNNTLVQIARGFSKNRVYSIAAIILSILKMLLVFFSLMVFNFGLNGVIAALLISTFSSLCFVCIKLKIWQYIDRTKISWFMIKELLNYSWPLVPNGLSGWILRLSDRLIITFVLGIEQNAIYAVANKIPNLLTTVNTTFSMAWQENASVASDDSDASEYYSKMFDTFFRIMAGSTCFLISFTPLLFLILIHGEYNSAYYQMPILFMGIFYSCLSSFLGGIYIAKKKTKSVGITTILAAACNFIINIATVNIIGITAGSLSTLVSYVLLTYYRMYDIKKHQPIRYRFGSILVVNIILVVMCVLCFLRNRNIDIINAALGIVFAVIVNYQLIINGIRFIKAKLRRL